MDKDSFSSCTISHNRFCCVLWLRSTSYDKIWINNMMTNWMRALICTILAIPCTTRFLKTYRISYFWLALFFIIIGLLSSFIFIFQSM